MSRYNTRLVIAGCWLTLALTTFFASDASSVQNWVLLATAGVGPPLVMLGLWKETPLTISKVLRAGEERS